MQQEKPRECCCECHGEVRVHVTVTCDCGGPIRPPKRPRPCCPPPPRCQPGTVDVPQPEPPPSAPAGAAPDPNRPPPGSGGEIPWFRGQIGTISRNGPVFGPRKDEFLPFLLI